MKKQSNRAAYEKRKGLRAQEPASLREVKHPEREETTEIRSKRRNTMPARRKSVSFASRKKVLWIGILAAIAVIVIVIAAALLGGGNVGHGVFFVNSDTAVADNETKTLTQRFYLDGDVVMAPAESFCEIMDIKLKWDEKDGDFSVKGPNGKVKGTVGDAKVMIDGEERTWSAGAVVTDDILYLPVADLSEALGYAAEYTESVQRFDIFIPDDGNHPPEVDFSSDKQTYQVGETVIFTIEASDRDNDDIVDYQWENRQEQYDTPGKVTVTLRVKDSRGAWSEQVSHALTIVESDDEEDESEGDETLEDQEKQA